MTLEEVASAQVELLSPPATLPPTFHPSIGQPEECVRYRVCPPFPATRLSKVSDDAAVETVARVPATSPTVSAPPEARATLTVTIPPASIPLIFAHRQWRAGLILADLIAYAASPQRASDLPGSPFDVRQRTVLELGCGTGVPAMVAAKFGGAAMTLVTDYDSPSLISTLSRNVNSNFTVKDVKMRIRPAGYTWGSHIEDIDDVVASMLREQQRAGEAGVPGQFSQPSGFDRVLLADCLWDPLSHADLVKSLGQLVLRDPTGHSRVLVVSGLHTGRDKLTSFMRRAARIGLVLADIDAEAGFPSMPEDEAKVVKSEQGAMSVDDPLYHAPQYVYELELAEDHEENVDVEETVSKSSSDYDGQIQVIDTGHMPRLSGRRRAFVLEERPEERKELGGVHRRNRWITIWALKWVKESSKGC